LEGQVSRYKAAADHYESSEDNLKADKRRLQREVKPEIDRKFFFNTFILAAAM